MLQVLETILALAGLLAPILLVFFLLVDTLAAWDESERGRGRR